MVQSETPEMQTVEKTTAEIQNSRNVNSGNKKLQK